MVSFRDGGDQDRIRIVHQKRPDQNRTKKSLFADQGKNNVVQLCMAGENIGFTQGNCFFAGRNMHFYTGIIGREMLLKDSAETGMLALFH